MITNRSYPCIVHAAEECDFRQVTSITSRDTMLDLSGKSLNATVVQICFSGRGSGSADVDLVTCESGYHYDWETGLKVDMTPAQMMEKYYPKGTTA